MCMCDLLLRRLGGHGMVRSLKSGAWWRDSWGLVRDRGGRVALGDEGFEEMVSDEESSIYFCLRFSGL